MSRDVESKRWHSLSVDELFDSGNIKADGLNREEAEKRFSKYGPNELTEEKRKSPVWLLLEQFKNILVIILLIATGLSFAIGEIYDGIVIIVIVAAVAVLGFTQEYRAEKALEALKKMTAPTALVLRDGKEIRVKTAEIVPGDILLLSTGDRVPADARLIEAFNLKTDEASLTGESVPVSKDIRPLPLETPVSERSNTVFSGTIIANGRGKALVTSTGMNTEFGKIAQMVQVTDEEETPLEKRMSNVGKWLGIFSIVVCAAIAILGVIRQHGVLEMILWGVSLAVAAVPEALPAVVTGALAIGMYRMAKQSAIVRKLPAVETLGSTSVICSDKTGTMTKGEMTVQSIYLFQKPLQVTGIGYEPKGEFLFKGKIMNTDNKDLQQLLTGAILCNDAKLDLEKGKWTVVGDSTEGALLVAAAKVSMLKADLERQMPRISEIPFSSERKRMTTVHDIYGDGKVAYMKGAPEIVLQHCSRILSNGQVQEITVEDRKLLVNVMT